jgi:hypothetical protein
MDCPVTVGRERDFSLVWVSLPLTAGAIIMVSILPGREAGSDAQKGARSVSKMDEVEDAMRAFMLFNGRRPCPADGQYDVNNANFGREAANPGSCTGGTLSAPLGPDSTTGNIVAGVIPTKSLNIPDENAFDEWGRCVTHVVDKRATANASCLTLQNYPTNNGTGGITVQNSNAGSVLDHVMVTYISHGQDGFGAFPAQGSTVSGRINTGTFNADRNVNAGVSTNFTYTANDFTNVKIQKEATATFKDILHDRDDLKNRCCIGKICTSTGFRIDGWGGINLGAYPITSLDLNNGHIDDFALAAANSRFGVLFGHTGHWDNPTLLGDLVDGVRGIYGHEVNWRNTNVSYIDARDVNGDGKTDLILRVDCSLTGGGESTLVIIFGGQGAGCRRTPMRCTGAAPPGARPARPSTAPTARRSVSSRSVCVGASAISPRPLITIS